jgi:hypothetical protein
MRTIVYLMVRLDPRWEPYAGKLHVRICAGVLSNEHPYRDRAFPATPTCERPRAPCPRGQTLRPQPRGQNRSTLSSFLNTSAGDFAHPTHAPMVSR